MFLCATPLLAYIIIVLLDSLSLYVEIIIYYILSMLDNYSLCFWESGGYCSSYFDRNFLLLRLSLGKKFTFSRLFLRSLAGPPSIIAQCFIRSNRVDMFYRFKLSTNALFVPPPPPPCLCPSPGIYWGKFFTLRGKGEHGEMEC